MGYLWARSDFVFAKIWWEESYHHEWWYQIAVCVVDSQFLVYHHEKGATLLDCLLVTRPVCVCVCVWSHWCGVSAIVYTVCQTMFCLFRVYTVSPPTWSVPHRGCSVPGMARDLLIMIYPAPLDVTRICCRTRWCYVPDLVEILAGWHVRIYSVR